MKVVVIGSSNIDMVAQVNHLPAPGETVGDASFMQSLGGKGANQAVAAARLGGSVIFVTSLGNDMYADILKKNFEKEGISLRIPASVAQSWKVAENGTIQALVQKVSNHSYEIKIYKGTQKITDIPGSRIMIPVKEMFPNGNPETMEITDSRGRKLKTFLDKKQDLLIVDTDETGIFCVRGRKIDDIEENPFAVAVLTTATMITVLIVGIRSRSGKRGDSHKGEK